VRFSAGTKLDRYDVVGIIGAGGMGEVYRAFDPRLNRSVALKLLTSLTLSESEQRKRVLAEARSAASLNHPGIVTVYEVGEHEGRIFIVMELLEGQTLRRLAQAERLNPRLVTHLGELVADALAGAHARGIIHGDIKPENIIVLPDGRIKLLDFGISRHLISLEGMHATASSTDTTLRQAGTLLYMSPEQLRGERPDGRSDLFSLGIVLYEALTGSHPFPGATTTEIVGNILHRPFEPLIHRAPDVPPDLVRIVVRLLEKSPQARYASAREAQQDLASAARNAEFRSQLPESVARKRAIAVLPFHLLTPHPDREYLGVALADAVINELSAVAEWLVRPTNTVLRYAGQTPEPEAVARELNVHVVMTGSIQLAGSRVRAHVQAWNVADGSTLYTNKHEAEVSELFALQDDIASGLRRALGARTSSGESHTADTPPTRNSTAYELFLRASERLSHLNRWDTRSAIDMLQSAVELDPGFAEAWARLAEAYTLLTVTFEPGPQWTRRAEQAIRRALAVDPQNGSAHCSRGRLLWTPAKGFKSKLALRTLNTALRLNAGCFQAQLWRCLILLHIGLLSEARAGLMEVLATHPNDAFTLVFFGQVASYSWNWDEAREYEERALRIDPANLWARVFYPTVELYSGRLEHAEKAIRAARDVLPDDPWVTVCEAMLLAKRGDNKRADQVLARALRGGRTMLHTHHMWHTAAATYALVGNNSPATSWLVKAAMTGLPNYNLFRDDPNFASLRNDKRYTSLLIRLRREFLGYEREFGNYTTVRPTGAP
jgi:serine/threonine protein kinase/tetratricopeptide (TPR) repeat protein